MHKIIVELTVTFNRNETDQGNLGVVMVDGSDKGNLGFIYTRSNRQPNYKVRNDARLIQPFRVFRPAVQNASRFCIIAKG